MPQALAFAAAAAVSNAAAAAGASVATQALLAHGAAVITQITVSAAISAGATCAITKWHPSPRARQSGSWTPITADALGVLGGSGDSPCSLFQRSPNK